MKSKCIENLNTLDHWHLSVVQLYYIVLGFKVYIILIILKIYIVDSSYVICKYFLIKSILEILTCIWKT